MAGKSLATIQGFLSKLPIKAPWKITGVASSSEFLTYTPGPNEYRKHSPASPPVQVAIPHAEPNHIYDIKYYVRDTRREGMLVGGTNKKHLVKREVDPLAPLEGLQGLDTPPTPGTPYKWSKRRPLLDYDNNGYT